MLGVLALGALNGDTVVLESDGDGADAALDDLVALLVQDLDEPVTADG
jgi:phosphocarrier protein